MESINKTYQYPHTLLPLTPILFAFLTLIATNVLSQTGLLGTCLH